MKTMNILRFLPEKKLWLLPIAVLSLLNPLHYVILAAYPPAGYAFSGMGGDDSTFFTTMASVKSGLESPWSGESIFYNPAFGPLYILLPLGLISPVTGVSTFPIFLAFKFLSTLFFLLVAYQFIRHFSQNYNRAYFLFLLTAGFGGIAVLLLKIFTSSDLFAPTPLYAFGISIVRIAGGYQLLPFGTALLSILFAEKTGIVKSGIMLGITFLMYPFYGAGAAVALFLLMISKRIPTLFGLVKIAAISLPFAAAWIMPYLIDKTRFESYAAVGQDIGGIFLPTLILGWGPAFLLACYWIYTTSPRLRRSAKIKAVVWLVSLALFSFANISLSFWATFDSFARNALSSLGLLHVSEQLGIFSLIFQIPLFLLIAVAAAQVYRDLKKPEHKFIFLWLTVTGILVMLPSAYAGALGGKIQAFIWIPVCIIGAEGAAELAKRWNSARILTTVFLLSLPTLFFLSIFVQAYPRTSISSGDIEQCCYFYTADEREAFAFLATQPRGIVFSSIETGTWLPAHTGQKALLHRYTRNFVQDAEEKTADYKTFFSPNATSAERKGIAEKYGIRYVFLGPSERKLGLSAFREQFLKQVFENKKVAVYEVQAF